VADESSSGGGAGSRLEKSVRQIVKNGKTKTFLFEIEISTRANARIGESGGILDNRKEKHLPRIIG